MVRPVAPKAPDATHKTFPSQQKDSYFRILYQLQLLLNLERYEEMMAFDDLTYAWNGEAVVSQQHPGIHLK
jgi:hypothetical protein